MMIFASFLSDLKPAIWVIRFLILLRSVLIILFWLVQNPAPEAAARSWYVLTIIPRTIN